MIVVEESVSVDIVEATLKSAVQFVDACYVYLCGHSEELRSKIEALGLMVTIRECKWVDRDYNQTLALLYTRKQHPNGWSWVIEPGEIITCDGGFDWGEISDEVTSLDIETSMGDYSRVSPRILSNLFEWCYQNGAPKLDDVRCRSEMLKNIHCHSGERGDRHSEMTAGKLFQLGQDLNSMGNKREAKKIFQKCISLEGDDNIRYGACLELISLIDNIDRKCKYGWKAIQLDPTRFEAPERILAHAVSQRDTKAYTQEMVAMGMSVRARNSAGGSWSFSDAFSIALYYTGFYRQSAEECLRTLQRCPEAQKPRVTINLKFATDAMKSMI